MLKKTVSYTDYDGNERTEDFYFNINKAELTMMEMSEHGGLEKKLDRIIKSQDAPEIMNTFKELILSSYGTKSPDGKRFIKSKELRDEFEQTEAYSIIFMEILTDPNASSAFISGILPKDLTNKSSVIPAPNK